MVDALKKNLERVTLELRDVKSEYYTICRRFKYVTLPGMKSRVPQNKAGTGLPHSFPTNNEVFHLLTAFVEEFYDKAPRVAAYRDIVLGAVIILFCIF
jgi:hypothetical protein